MQAFGRNGNHRLTLGVMGSRLAEEGSLTRGPAVVGLRIQVRLMICVRCVDGNHMPHMICGMCSVASGTTGVAPAWPHPNVAQDNVFGMTHTRARPAHHLLSVACCFRVCQRRQPTMRVRLVVSVISCIAKVQRWCAVPAVGGVRYFLVHKKCGRGLSGHSLPSGPRWSDCPCHERTLARWVKPDVKSSFSL